MAEKQEIKSPQENEILMLPELNKTVEDAVEKVMSDTITFNGWIATVILVILVVLIRYFLVRWIKGDQTVLSKNQRRMINRVSSGSTLLLLISIILVWAPQLQSFALSLTAFAVAMVLITKEVLTCLTGGFYRSATRNCDIGDWLRIDGFTGEVLRMHTLSTELEEIDIEGQTYQFTGRTVQIPNSKFFTGNIENVNFQKNFALTDISIMTPDVGIDPDIILGQLEKIVDEKYQPLKAEAYQYFHVVEKACTVDFPDPEPKYSIGNKDGGNRIYSVRLFLKTATASVFKVEVTRTFLSWIHNNKPDAKQDKEKEKKW